MSIIKTIIKRELKGYFFSPVAYVFIVIFLIATAGTTFFIGGFLEANQASLESFFLFHPWLYLFLIPSIGMRLWAEERNTGTIELLFTLPIDLKDAILSKFLAGWIFITVALVLTFPMLLTVGYLGDPDYGVIFASYFGSFLMAGAYLSISCATSALTRNQIISFILSVIICFVLVLLGWGVFQNILNQIFPVWVADFIAGLSLSGHFNSISRGILDLRDIVYFLSVIAGGLLVNGVILDAKKSV